MIASKQKLPLSFLSAYPYNLERIFGHGEVSMTVSEKSIPQVSRQSLSLDLRKVTLGNSEDFRGLMVSLFSLAMLRYRGSLLRCDSSLEISLVVITKQKRASNPAPPYFLVRCFGSRGFGSESVATNRAGPSSKDKCQLLPGSRSIWKEGQ